jgi:putative membrane protein
VRRFLLRLLVTAIGLYVAVQLVPGIVSSGSWPTFIGMALILTVVNVLVRPVLKILTGPLILLTLGLFVLVVNALTFWLAGAIAQAFSLSFQVRGFVPAFWGALIVGAVNWALTVLVRDHRGRRLI